MNKDRNERPEEQAQFIDSTEALQDYLHQQVRRALADLFTDRNLLFGGDSRRG